MTNKQLNEPNEPSSNESNELSNEFDHCDFVSREHASGDDPFAWGGYGQMGKPVRHDLSSTHSAVTPTLATPTLATPTLATPTLATPTPVQIAPARRTSLVPPPTPQMLARRAEVQKALDADVVRRKALAKREEAQYSILDGVVWSIREALRQKGISVTCLEGPQDFQYRQIHTHIDFQITEIGKTDFKRIVAERFVKEFLQHNPKASHMFCARLDLPTCVQVARHFYHDGLMLRGVGDYFIGTDQTVIRVDCLWAVATEENLLPCPTPVIQRALEGKAEHIPRGAGLTHRD